MKLHIENIMAVGTADIVLDGITVIVGNNNTGKSTTGKALWAMFNALSGLAEKTCQERINDCKKILQRYLFRFPGLKQDFTDVSGQLVKKKLSVSDLIGNFQAEYRLQDSKEPEPDWLSIQKQLQDVLDINEDDLQKQIVLTCFNRIFGDQFIPLFPNHGVPLIQMEIQGKKMAVTFERSLPEIEIQLDLQNNAFYFDNPALLGNLEKYTDDLYPDQVSRITNSFCMKKSAAESIILRKKFESVEALLAEVLGGKVVYNRDSHTLNFASSKYTKPMNLSNLSQGAKSMAVLQAAFSQGAVQDRDVLILDEPEIHLHPEWQIKYAELIVLLQKTFDLTVLLTSHSPDFVEAIRLYSHKYGLSGKLTGYISGLQDDGTAAMQKVTDDQWDSMFEKFSGSVDTLMDLRAEVENRSYE